MQLCLYTGTQIYISPSEIWTLVCKSAPVEILGRELTKLVKIKCHISGVKLITCQKNSIGC